MVKNNDGGMAVFAHLLGLFIGFIGPLVVYLTVKDDDFVLNHSKSALNWQLSMLVYLLISFILILVLAKISVVVLFVAIFFDFVLGILNLIFSITGAVRASNGQKYKYPMSISFFKI